MLLVHIGVAKLGKPALRGVFSVRAEGEAFGRRRRSCRKGEEKGRLSGRRRRWSSKDEVGHRRRRQRLNARRASATERWNGCLRGESSEGWNPTSATGMKQGRAVRGGDEGVQRVRNPAGAGRSGLEAPAAEAATFLER
jgi:hypothetical protein